MDLITILIIAIIVGIAGADYTLEVFQLYRPIVLGPIIGLILGDLQNGLVIGATFEMMFMGLWPVGGAQPPNMVIGTAIGVTFGIISNMGASAAIAIGYAASVLMQAINVVKTTAFAFFDGISDSMIAKGNYKGFIGLNWLSMLINFLSYAIFTFIVISLGAETAQNIVNVIPDWITGGLEVASGVLPAIGFAILLSTMFKREYSIFLIMGFVMAVYLSLPILAIAIIASCIAVYDYQVNKNNGAAAKEGEHDGI